MSRSVDVNLIVNQIVEANRGRDTNTREVIQRQFERLTMGLAEYERQQVAWLVNFRLSSAVL